MKEGYSKPDDLESTEPRITNAADLRALLAESIAAVMEGRMNVSQANAVASLSGELHKSIRQEWDQRVYLAENLTFDQGEIVRTLLEHRTRG